jgi:HlyD family secretion protein
MINNPNTLRRHLRKLASMIVLMIIFSCSANKDPFDASGTFEAEETIISAEATGTILKLELQEGQVLRAGQVLGFIDSVQLYLKKKQLLSQIKSTLSQRPDINTQVAAMKVQLTAAERDQTRFGNLLKAGAATQKQYDDIESQVKLLRNQLAAQESSLGISKESLTEQTSPLKVQIAQVEDQLAKCKITNPINGTVLSKYAEVYEMAATGKPLYKIADLTNITLRAYIQSDQLSTLKIGQSVTVLVDDGPGKYRSMPGVITWISDKAEFTPKTIQTKDERANLAYAVKITVKNDGYLKIGMYGEVKFTK